MLSYSDVISIISSLFGRDCCYLSVVRLLFGFCSYRLALSGCYLDAISVLFLELGRIFRRFLRFGYCLFAIGDVVWLLFSRDSSSLTTSACYFDICVSVISVIWSVFRRYSDDVGGYLVVMWVLFWLFGIGCYVVAILMLSLLFDDLSVVTWM